MEISIDYLKNIIVEETKKKDMYRNTINKLSNDNKSIYFYLCEAGAVAKINLINKLIRKLK